MEEENRSRQGIRITTWNVNGIRNPFGYQPWRQERTFAAMFNILDADILVMQETKIQRKDLGDDMVLVPGWDVYFSLPKHKKGYSGVAIYTRSSVCAPIRAEEGITGILTPPNSSTSYFDLPEDQQIGGYLTPSQLSNCFLDAATLDSEGRCVLLEFPAFVLIGVYCPANRDETRDEFRIGFLYALDFRVRNLVARGKRVFLTGDLNIIREEIDTANAAEQLKKQDITIEEYISTPARRMLNQLLVDGRVIGDHDEGREDPVMWDICRSFHPDRKGMFTCWEQKINARPGNFGSRIDYVLCSEDWRDWFCRSDIQEGLMGSDHCPVYAVIKDEVEVDGKHVNIKDIMSAGMFRNGVRQRQWSIKDLLPMSAKLIPEFDRRRTIKDMFGRKQSTTIKPQTFSSDEQQIKVEQSNTTSPSNLKAIGRSLSAAMLPPSPKSATGLTSPIRTDSSSTTPVPALKSPKKDLKRPADSLSTTSSTSKKNRNPSSSRSTARSQLGRGQSSLTGFFKPKPPEPGHLDETCNSDSSNAPDTTIRPAPKSTEPFTLQSDLTIAMAEGIPLPEDLDLDDGKTVIDPIVAKEGWSKLLGRRVVPRCDHNEPCISLVTKKAGVNCGRSFYMCPRPIGPSGQKEKNTQWRCGTFIWSSDWAGD